MAQRNVSEHRDPEWLTAGQAARFLGVAQSTIRRWSDQGRVPTFYTPGGHRRYRRVDLDTLVSGSGRPGRAHDLPHVLLVVADDRVRDLVRATLELEGYSISEAASAEEGMASIDERKPDAILLDVTMPHVGGWEMLRRAQGRHGAGAIPVVTFGGTVGDEARRRGVPADAGMSLDLQQLVDRTRAIAPV